MKQLLTLLFIGLMSLCAQTLPAYVATNGLVGWWPFNGNANDVSGNGNNGTVNGASLTNDRYNLSSSAYLFQGSQSIICPSNPSFNVGKGSFTISCWATSVGTGEYQALVTRYEYLGLNDIPVSFSLFYKYGSPGMLFGNNSAQVNVDTVSNTLSWKHVVGVYDSINGTVSIYINGSLANSGAIPSNVTNGNNNGVLRFGVFFPNLLPAHLEGKLDDIGIWNRALSVSEIQELFESCSEYIQSQPLNFIAYSGIGWANFKCKSTDTSATYQWQQNVGGGWANLSNFGNYTGTTSDSLVITGVTASMNNYGYRCIVTGCKSDTSDVAVLNVVNGIGLGESALQKLTVSPNPTAGIVSLNTAVVGNYELLTLDGRVLESGTAKKDYDLTTYPKGVYHLRLSTDEGSRVLKVVKNERKPLIMGLFLCFQTTTC
jgi:hypothetical protein